MMLQDIDARTGGQVLVASVIDTTKALSYDLIGQVSDICRRAEAAEGGAVVVVRLMASGEFEPWPGSDADIAMVSKWEQALRRLERLAAATVVLVDGPCGPSALELLLTADHRIGGEKLSIDLGEVTWSGMVSFRLVKQLGLTRARKLLRLAGPVGGEQLAQFEVVDEITPDAEARQAEIAERSATRSGADIALERALLTEATSLDFEEAFGNHLAAVDRMLRRQKSVGIGG